MLWWLFGEHSRTLKRHFGDFSCGAVAIVAGIELGELTTVSVFGPIAAPAMLERVLRLAAKQTVQEQQLATVLDSISLAELQTLKTLGKDQPPRMFPIMTAIELAKNNRENWQVAFEKVTGLKPTIEFKPIEFATQIYYEHLLGQLL